MHMPLYVRVCVCMSASAGLCLGEKSEEEREKKMKCLRLAKKKSSKRVGGKTEAEWIVRLGRKRTFRWERGDKDIRKRSALCKKNARGNGRHKNTVQTFTPRSVFSYSISICSDTGVFSFPSSSALRTLLILHSSIARCV